MLDNYINRVHKYKISLVSALIKAVCDYIDINLEKNPTLDELASFSNYSKYYLSKKFKQVIGETVTDYMNKLRIERSKELLQNTTLSIHATERSLVFAPPATLPNVSVNTRGVPLPIFVPDNSTNVQGQGNISQTK